MKPPIGVRIAIGAAVLAAVLAVVFMTRLTIRGSSMAPGLVDGQSLFVLRFPGAVRRGDIVAFRWPVDHTKSFVQRVVGLPGEQIVVIQGRVKINGRELDEPYVNPAWRSSGGMDVSPNITIPPDTFYVLGDNRMNASDSRTWGVVPRQLIWARLFR